MSYILDALKKSETERQQGRVPDLGQQIRMIHRNNKRGIPAVVWLAVALVVNAVVLLVVFWPQPAPEQTEPVATTATQSGAAEVAQEAAVEAEAVLEQPLPDLADPALASGMPGPVVPSPAQLPQSPPAGATPSETPLVIHPSPRPLDTLGAGPAIPEPFTGRVPHLVEMPMAFQRQVPDLVFNSHVYASNPADRRVMINNRLLRTGESMGNLKVERITEEGVELSMDGQRFRVGVVRDWSAPR